MISKKFIGLTIASVLGALAIPVVTYAIPPIDTTGPPFDIREKIIPNIDRAQERQEDKGHDNSAEHLQSLEDGMTSGDHWCSPGLGENDDPC